MFTLNLDPHPAALSRDCAEVHLRVGRHLSTHLEPKPVPQIGQRCRQVPDPSSAGPDIVEVLAVAAGGLDAQLVKASTAPEDQFLSEVRVVGDLISQSPTPAPAGPLALPRPAAGEVGGAVHAHGPVARSVASRSGPASGMRPDRGRRGRRRAPPGRSRIARPLTPAPCSSWQRTVANGTVA